MALPHSASTSPYNFGLGTDFQIAAILPFFYFFTSMLPNISSLWESLIGDPTSSPNTCRLTGLDDWHATLDERWSKLGEQAVFSLILILIICLALRHQDFKRWDYYDHHQDLSTPTLRTSPAAARLRHWLYGGLDVPVTPPDDYFLTRRWEAMRLLFLVVISGLLCPVADYVARRGDGTYMPPEYWQLSWSYLGKILVPVGFVFYRYGAARGVQLTIVVARITGPVVMAAAAAKVLAVATFGERYGVVEIWNRRIERWAEAWEREKFEAETAQWQVLCEMMNQRETSDPRERVKEVRDEVGMGERKKELVIWRRGMKEGKGYGPDYWLPREKMDKAGAADVRQRQFK